MTAQFCDTLRLDGRDRPLCTTPLSDYFALTGTWPELEMAGSNLWRGYLGQWEIVAGRFYLIGVTARLVGGHALTLAHLFPGFAQRVFAHWYSGELRLPEGELLQYVHQGFRSVHERARFIRIEQGVVIGERLQHNAPPTGLEPLDDDVAVPAFLRRRSRP